MSSMQRKAALEPCAPSGLCPFRCWFPPVKLAIRITALAALFATPLVAVAESTLIEGAGAAAADLNFRVVLPRVLFLAVGTGSAGTALGNNATVNRATFNYSANPQAVGTGAPAAAITGRTVRVRVYGNNGQVTITATNPANLVSGSNTIPFSQFTVTSTSPANLPAPSMGGGVVNPVLNTARVTNRAANWRFTYANTVTPASGTYNGQVTYTATMP